ncbi:MAG: DUF4238 domain-containing protein [Candidatus Komeilibacteria bacterium]|nr:DUF4238 domain-containing protein [Candidatus Komeilibacteria bacterium]
MSNQYRNNHYVPVWYQKRFLSVGQKDNELYYLNFKPGQFIDPRGIAHPSKPIKKQGFNFCFAKKDLYTTQFQNVESTKIEQYFFGKIDRNGRNAVEYFTNFQHPSVDGKAFEDLMLFMSTQKLRTPKGLAWLSEQSKTASKNQILESMLKLRQLHCAIWTECVWQIADATQLNVKFIISDHPVTVYNRVCGPRSQWCREANDPDIWLNATHTIFPLSLNKILILTNLSWVRNPYQPERSLRPNAQPFRGAIFKFTEIQTLRHLTEQEVWDINYIIKRRAYQFIGAAKEAWLYPEKYVSTTQWNMFGDGYLLMPDPRPIHWGGEIMWGNNDGTGGAMDEYGRLPWDPDYNKETKNHSEFNSLDKFKGEFARLYGPYRRGRTFEIMTLDKERDDDKFHQYHLNLEKKRKKR